MEIEQINNNAEKEDDSSSTSEETTSPSPKRQNQKITPPATAKRKSTRNRQATLATALGNPIPISTVQITSATGTKQFEIDSPSEKSKPDSPKKLQNIKLVCNLYRVLARNTKQAPQTM